MGRGQQVSTERERKRGQAKVMTRLAISSILLLLTIIIFPSLAIAASTFISLPINFASAENNLDDQPAADLESLRRSWKHQFNGRVGERTWDGSGGTFGKRAWNSQFSGGMGKRAWNSQFSGGMGKRAWVRS